jgi:hypothetical protein
MNIDSVWVPCLQDNISSEHEEVVIYMIPCKCEAIDIDETGYTIQERTRRTSGSTTWNTWRRQSIGSSHQKQSDNMMALAQLPPMPTESSAKPLR